tara:strand:+ start:301 stop:402 length:102 start_codon:yes stop_codon:yes gene_type:complete
MHVWYLSGVIFLLRDIEIFFRNYRAHQVQDLEM